MNSRWSPLILLALAVLVFGAQAAYFYPILPGRLASHFGPEGRPDGWMEKGPFFVSMALTMAFLWASLSGMALFLERMPRDSFNLPRKDYWLAPEQAAATYAYLRGYLFRLCAAVLGLFLALAQFVFQANLRPGEPRLGPGMSVLTVLFVATLAASTVALVLRFRNAPKG